MKEEKVETMQAATDITRHFETMLGRASATASLPAPPADWCLVLVRPGYEQDCRDRLRHLGVGAWWPNYARDVGYKDRQTGKRLKRSALLSVLPGVILCPARLDERFWQAIDLAPGAQNVARKASGEVLLLHDLDIALIHKIEEGLNKGARPKAEHRYAVGDTVRFIDDQLRRFPAADVIGVSKDGGLQLELSLFGRMTRWTAASWQVEPVEPRLKNQLKAKPTDAWGRPAKSPSGRTAG